MGRLDRQVAAITGGASDIGEATARLFGEGGILMEVSSDRYVIASHSPPGRTRSSHVVTRVSAAARPAAKCHRASDDRQPLTPAMRIPHHTAGVLIISER